MPGWSNLRAGLLEFIGGRAHKVEGEFTGSRCAETTIWAWHCWRWRPHLTFQQQLWHKMRETAERRQEVERLKRKNIKRPSKVRDVSPVSFVSPALNECELFYPKIFETLLTDGNAPNRAQFTRQPIYAVLYHPKWAEARPSLNMKAISAWKQAVSEATSGDPTEGGPNTWSSWLGGKAASCTTRRSPCPRDALAGGSWNTCPPKALPFAGYNCCWHRQLIALWTPSAYFLVGSFVWFVCWLIIGFVCLGVWCVGCLFPR